MGVRKEINNLEELFDFFKWLIRHRKEIEEFMSQVQFTATITVNPAVQPLAIDPTVGKADFVVGVTGNVVLGAISGGVAPYNAAVDPNSPNPLPPGLAVSVDASNNLVLSGAATDPGSGDVVIAVVDSAPPSMASAKVGVKVT